MPLYRKSAVVLPYSWGKLLTADVYCFLTEVNVNRILQHQIASCCTYTCSYRSTHFFPAQKDTLYLYQLNSAYGYYHPRPLEEKGIQLESHCAAGLPRPPSGCRPHVVVALPMVLLWTGADQCCVLTVCVLNTLGPYLPIRGTTYLGLYLPTHQGPYLSIRGPNYLPGALPVWGLTCLPTRGTTYLPVALPAYPPGALLTYLLSIWGLNCLSTRATTYLSRVLPAKPPNALIIFIKGTTYLSGALSGALTANPPGTLPIYQGVPTTYYGHYLSGILLAYPPRVLPIWGITYQTTMGPNYLSGTAPIWGLICLPTMGTTYLPTWGLTCLPTRGNTLRMLPTEKVWEPLS